MSTHRQYTFAHYSYMNVIYVEIYIYKLVTVNISGEGIGT